MAPTKKTIGTGILVAAGVGVAGYYLLKSSGISLFGSSSLSTTPASKSGSSGSSTATQPSPTGNPSLQFYGWAEVQYGSQGIQVLDVQKALTALGYNPASNQDGIFGPITESSVKSFQSAKGISVDGIVGPQTYGQLNIALQKIGGFWKQS